jgi:hypothetical protein
MPNRAPIYTAATAIAFSIAGASASLAQSQAPTPNPAPCTVAPQPLPCGTAPAPAAQTSGKPDARPDSVDKFPFPGETTPAAPNPASSTATDKPAETPEAPKPPADAFPFPGEAPAAPAPAPASSSSSSSSSSSADPTADPAATDPAAAGLKDKGSEGSQAPQGRHLLHRVNPIGTKLQSADDREAEDLDVAHFYLQSGDIKGAYLRTQDAVRTAPDDPDAHFALAEAALKLDKRDEAIAEYTACLKLDPTDKEAKAARKQLAKLKP